MSETIGTIKTTVLPESARKKPDPSGLGAAPCCVPWVPGDKPDTPEGSSTLMWVTTRHRESGKIGVGVMTYQNAHVMPLSDQCCDPPDCAVPHRPTPDGDFEEYEWTCWSEGYCEYCECEWVWDNPYVDIIAHAPVVKPEPFAHNKQLTNPCKEQPHA